jgi:glycosyltransferase involved in cell wall biosynthesis
MILVFASPALKRWANKFRRYAADTGSLYAANRNVADRNVANLANRNVADRNVANRYAVHRYAANLYAPNRHATNFRLRTLDSRQIMRRTLEQSLADPISVCHIASGERWAGAEAQVATVLKTLARRSDVRVCAVLLNEGRLADEIRAAGIEVGVFPREENSFWRTYLRACLFLKDRKIQVLHSHRYKENLLAVLLKLRLRNPVLVRTQHGSPEPGGWRYRLVYRIDHATAPAVDKVISVSSHLQSYLLTYLKPSQIAVIHNGIDLKEVRSALSKPDAKRRLGIAPDAPVVGIVARLDKVKRHDLFLRTAVEIARALPDAVFVVAGSGVEQSRLAEMAQSLGISGRVKFLGHRPDSYDVMRALDVLLVTSDHEGLPLAVLEAMALGTVVVSRQVGGIPEVIRNGSEGLLVDSDDAAMLARSCIRNLRDDGLRDMLAANARRRMIREFSAESNAEQLVHMYRVILSHGTLSAPLAAVRPIAAGDRH